MSKKYTIITFIIVLTFFIFIVLLFSNKEKHTNKQDIIEITNAEELELYKEMIDGAIQTKKNNTYQIYIKKSKNKNIIFIKHMRHFEVVEYSQKNNVMYIQVNNNEKTNKTIDEYPYFIYSKIEIEGKINDIKIKGNLNKTKYKMSYLSENLKKELSFKINESKEISEKDSAMGVFFYDDKKSGEKIIFLKTNPFNRVLSITKKEKKVIIEYKIDEAPKSGVTFIPKYYYQIILDDEISEVDIQQR